MDSDNGTIGALIDNGYRIVVYCEARPCRHYAELDLTDLASASASLAAG
ncbi:MAG: hypothetical protein AAAC48_22760 [Phyllobacterium sp.]|jgi:hypothetical protein